jgi:protein O-mannosyl-transferase
MNKPINPNLALIAIVTTLLVICWPGLSGPFVLDDLPNLRAIGFENPPNYGKFIFSNESGIFGRSVSMMTFATNHFFRGEFDNFDLKLTNLTLHIANGLLLYCIVLNFLGCAGGRAQTQWIAVLVAALWLLNPINVSAVLYTIQRMALLACFFTFIGILSYVRWRGSNATTVISRHYYLLICAVSWPLAVLSKENGILLPFLILIVEFGFYSVGRTFQSVRVVLIGLLIGGVASIYVFQTHELLRYTDRGFSLIERLSTQPVVIVHYIRDLLIPLSTDIGLYNDDFPVYKTPLNFATISASSLIAILIMFGLLASEQSSLRRIFCGILFYFGAHSIESTAIPLEMYFEHRNYLPSAGLYLSLVLAAYAGISGRHNPRTLAISLSVIPLLWFSFVSYHKAQAWSSWTTVVTNQYEHHPTSARAGLEMASLLVDSNNIDAALAVNDLTALHNPKLNVNIKLQRFYLYCASGKSVDELEYGPLDGLLARGNELARATALDLLLETRDKNACPNLDFDRVMNRVSELVESSLRKQILTTTQAWHIEYYLVEFDRSLGRQDKVRDRLERSIRGGNVKAAYYAKDVLNIGSP